MSTAQPLIQLEGLYLHTKESSYPLLKGVDFSLFSGERTALVGGSGAGKTLLLRCLALIENWETGNLKWEGKDILDDDVPAYRAQVIYLHQRPALEEGTVEDNLRSVFYFKTNRIVSFNKNLIEDYLSRIGLEPSFLAKPAKLLSGGESQIVALLRAVQLNPRVLLLDEPTAALDAGKASAVEQIVSRWFSEPSAAKAFVWVTHNEAQSSRVADRVVRMERGILK